MDRAATVVRLEDVVVAVLRTLQRDHGLLRQQGGVLQQMHGVSFLDDDSARSSLVALMVACCVVSASGQPDADLFPQVRDHPDRANHLGILALGGKRSSK